MDGWQNCHSAVTSDHRRVATLVLSARSSSQVLMHRIRGHIHEHHHLARDRRPDRMVSERDHATQMASKEFCLNVVVGIVWCNPRWMVLDPARRGLDDQSEQLQRAGLACVTSGRSDSPGHSQSRSAGRMAVVPVMFFHDARVSSVRQYRNAFARIDELVFTFTWSNSCEPLAQQRRCSGHVGNRPLRRTLHLCRSDECKL